MPSAFPADNPTNSTTDRINYALSALSAVRQYQQDWQKYGTDRVYKYFYDVNGDWLDNFDEIDFNQSPQDAD